MKLKMSEALADLSRHELLVQLVRAREHLLMTTEYDWYEGGMKPYKALDADAVAYLIEEVLELDDPGPGD